MSFEHVEPGGHTQRATQELQGLNVSLVTGGTADAKYDLPGISELDTIVAVHNNNAGTLTDVTDTVSIVSDKASGTLTLVSAIATDVAEVDGVDYTFSADGGVAHTDVAVGADDTESAANLAAAINAVEGGAGSPNEFVATSALGVVTITSRLDGAAGNATTISSVDTTITASAATLENGSDTGGVISTGATNQMVVYWFNKG